MRSRRPHRGEVACLALLDLAVEERRELMVRPCDGVVLCFCPSAAEQLCAADEFHTTDASSRRATRAARAPFDFLVVLDAIQQG